MNEALISKEKERILRRNKALKVVMVVWAIFIVFEVGGFMFALMTNFNGWFVFSQEEGFSGFIITMVWYGIIFLETGLLGFFMNTYHDPYGDFENILNEDFDSVNQVEYRTRNGENVEYRVEFTKDESKVNTLVYKNKETAIVILRFAKEYIDSNVLLKVNEIS